MAETETKPVEEPTTTEEPKETVTIEDGDDDDDIPALEQEGAAPSAASDAAAPEGAAEIGGGKQSRGEKKARKAIQKLGMKPVPNVNRVTVKRAKNMLFVINNPSVYRNPHSDTYVIFGQANMEDPTQQAAASAAKKFDAAPTPDFSAAIPSGDAEDAAGDKPAAQADDDDEAVDAEGLEEKDIELVMSQAQVSRARAVKALKAANGDIVNAIMEVGV